MSEPPTSSVAQDLLGLHHEGKPFASPLTCRSCKDRAKRDPLFKIMSPGLHYFLPCGHIQCRACMTEQHAREARLESPIACSICRTHLPVSKSHVHISQTANSPEYYTSVRDMNVFYKHSPYYAARDAFMLDRREFQEFFTGICRTSAVIYQPPDPSHPTFGITHRIIYDALITCLDGKMRMCYPDLLIEELMIAFNDLLFEFMVSRPGAPQHARLSVFETEDGKPDYVRRTEKVEQLKRKYVYLEQLDTVWKEIMYMCAAALVVKWSQRFM